MSSPERHTKSETGKTGQAGKTEEKVDPWSITGYLLAGMGFYGGIGWLVDRWAGTGDVFAPIGVVFGLAAGLYLTFRQLSVMERQEREALTRAKRLERLEREQHLNTQDRIDPNDSQDPHDKQHRR